MQNDIENILNVIAAKDLNAKTDFFLSADRTVDYADTNAVNLLVLTYCFSAILTKRFVY